jgi:hypothetical protein
MLEAAGSQRSALKQRTIWERRAEVGLLAPDNGMRAVMWREMRLMAVGGGENGYDPWPSFSKAHYSPAELVATSGAERVGKSVATAAEGMAWLPVSELEWITGPQYRDTLKEFDYMTEACLNAGLTHRKWISRSKDSSSTFEVDDGATHCTIETRSLWDATKALVSEAPDLIMVVEAGNVQDDPREKLRLRVTTRRGRVWFSGTLEEYASPWYEGMFDHPEPWPNKANVFAITVPLYENTQDFPGGIDNPEIQSLQQNLRPTTYQRRVVGKPAASELLVFNAAFHEKSTVPTFCEPRPFKRLDAASNRVPVTLAIDPGRRPSRYAVHFMQEQDGAEVVIDEVSCNEETHEGMIALCRERPAWENVTGGVIDPWAGNQKGMGYKQSPRDIWLAESGIDLIMPEPAPTPEQLIEVYWRFINDDRFFVDEEHNPFLVGEFGLWRYLKDAEGQPVRTTPLKRNCDGIKAVGYKLWHKAGRERYARALTRGRRQRAKPKAWRFK